ncbi:purine-nucleoside phosphorylase [Burkholderia oklahomensis]|uniref:Purine nucleoside permease family protein n=2 Tax=Burkholderia oklahomensis TaxID=342113 RepID=A0AAI8FSG5_9BURK|nr:purine nucleoside permease [Burkholderia oklahomensis]AIO70977.1 purine nucleoside permease family protein [Burkholderia oklahomensis]AOI40161.1 purine nucleoside permease [Burkholderia oklahomensis EO147]KUY58711.1 purine nucleoside permease [Burkholderia oklahomensis EO147]QPS39475.1 purine nucleoside permease [Burkholderia oklahomensis]
MLTRSILSAAVFSLAACAMAPSVAQNNGDAFVEAGAQGRPVKVMIITMFGPEGQAWLDRLGPWKNIAVPGLSPDYPDVHCNKQDVCVVTTGMGYANAASTMMALTFSRRFDLRQTYFLISGIAGVDPASGTLGTAAWSKYLVDFGIQWELDAREIPPGWNGGYLGINTKSPNDKPPLDYRTEVFQLNGKLADAAYALSRHVQLADSAQAQAARAKFNYAPANQPPVVTRCDTSSGNTWFSGTLLGERARQWTKILTDNKGTYCMTAQEDNATFEALKRASSVNRVDLNRVAVLRTGSDFDRPYQGQTSVDNLLNYAEQGGFPLATENLYRAGNPLVQDIVTHWGEWKDGVPRR